MSDTPVAFDQINLIVENMDATIAFYSRLGLCVPPASVWPPGSAARHTEVAMPNVVRLEFDNQEMVRIWHRDGILRHGVTRSVLAFRLSYREAVDVLYAAE